MEISVYCTLPDEAADIRTEVFVDEQGFREEFDSDDKNAIHLVGFIDGKSVATSRILKLSDSDFLIGRIAVRKAYRKCGYGAEIVLAAEKVIKENDGLSIYIHAQEQAARFYEKIGYSRTGERDFEEGCPHCMMIKRI